MKNLNLSGRVSQTNTAHKAIVCLALIVGLSAIVATANEHPAPKEMSSGPTRTGGYNSWHLRINEYLFNGKESRTAIVNARSPVTYDNVV